MNDIIEAEDFNPKKIYNDLMKRYKEAKKWMVHCYVEEGWTPRGEPLPFDMSIKDGVFSCGVIAPTYKEAVTLVANTLPVIRFLNDDEIK